MSDAAKKKNAKTYAAKRLAITYTEKICNKCNNVKSLEDFPPRKDNADGRHGSCRTCDNIRKKKYKPDSSKSRQYWLKSKFGIGLEEYNNLLQKQNGVCAICEDRPGNNRSLAVDHCHSTGAIRGLLCFRCNATLGKFNDDIKLFETAINYLKR